MILEILCVGNELLAGITLNSNAHWLAGEIARAGGIVRRVTVVRDDLTEISSTIVLRAVNRLGLEPDVAVGTELFIPEGASPFGTFPAEGEVARLTEGMGAGAIEGQTYVLQRNQTLDGVGALFNVNHYCLIERNGITNVRSISAGTLLIIPDDCGPYTGFDVVGTTEP